MCARMPTHVRSVRVHLNSVWLLGKLSVYTRHGGCLVLGLAPNRVKAARKAL